MIKKILSIAGTDPISGAGIQSDLKTFSALGTYGTTVITSLVDQNTQGVKSIYSINHNFVRNQLISVLNDIKIDSIKIGMVYNHKIIKIISKTLKIYNIPWIILDPVMISKNGNILLNKNSIEILKNELIPISSIITPNIPEAAMLLNCKKAINENDMIIQGKKLLKLGCKAVLIKGGHLNKKICPDWLITKNEILCFNSNRINTKNTHGTGCTLSAAIAALIPSYLSWKKTLNIVKPWMQKTIKNSNTLNIGKGIGPVHHFYKLWKNIKI